MRRAIGLIGLILVGTCLASFADTVMLTDGTTRVGIVSRIELGDSLEILMVNQEKREARLEAIPLGSVASVELDYIETALFTLVLRSGDIVTGILLNSPLDETLAFRTTSGEVLDFASSAVSEVRLGMRHPMGEPLPSLRPSFGFGVTLSANSGSLTRDAVAWFSPDWLLVASLGMQIWWEPGDPSVGVVNGLTYLHKLGRIYWGVGTTASYNMTKLSWHTALQFRVVVPVSLGGRNSFISLGIGVLGD